MKKKVVPVRTKGGKTLGMRVDETDKLEVIKVRCKWSLREVTRKDKLKTEEVKHMLL